MQAELSDKTEVPLDLALPAQILVLALNTLAFFHAGLSGLAFWRFGWAAGIIVLYLAPPMLVRLLFAAAGKPAGRIPVGRPGFFIWWASLNLQTLFNRFPACEELLRLIPGLYSAWLRLWGSRIGRVTYWAPGTLILDRSYLWLGDDVTLGAGARLNGHVVVKNEAGRAELIVDVIKIGDRATVGGYSLLAAGTEIAEGEATRAVLQSPPYSVWKNGRRVK